MRKPTRLPRPWDSPGKNTGVGCHFLLQCMKVKSESEVAQSCPTFSDLMDCSPPGSSARGIFQARVLQGGQASFFRIAKDIMFLFFLTGNRFYCYTPTNCSFLYSLKHILTFKSLHCKRAKQNQSSNSRLGQGWFKLLHFILRDHVTLTFQSGRVNFDTGRSMQLAQHYPAYTHCQSNSCISPLPFLSSMHHLIIIC